MINDPSRGPVNGAGSVNSAAGTLTITVEGSIIGEVQEVPLETIEIPKGTLTISKGAHVSNLTLNNTQINMEPNSSFATPDGFLVQNPNDSCKVLTFENNLPSGNTDGKIVILGDQVVESSN
ncbi:MAG TPA: hypothetical protein LFW21_02440 [Rickettsia endosymbiont of Pyrocoelia pectoralis]|nr:hypothetical protein [Rickettsia endosymbiont of Pyrocoelia pectoralis]